MSKQYSTDPTMDILGTLHEIKAGTDARLRVLERERQKILREREIQVRLALAAYRSREAA